MNVLTWKLMPVILRMIPSVSKLEICDKLRSYLRQYDLTLTEKEILFPDSSPYLQKLIQVMSASDRYEKSIPYDAIVIILETAEGVDLMLRTGHVFHFGKKSRVWLIENVYAYGEPLPFIVWWWGCSGYIVMQWQKIKRVLISLVIKQAKG